MKSLIIIGAGGHGRVARDVAAAIGYQEVLFLDDNPSIEGVIGPVFDYKKYIGKRDLFVAIGNNAIRASIQRDIMTCGGKSVTLVHPSAIIGSEVKIGDGAVVMPGAIINCNSTVGEGAIINTAASVDHDCVVGDFSHISVGAHLAGTVKVGNNCFIGAGATVINNIVINDGVTVGAGAVVIRNITEAGTYIGVPAKKK